MERSIKAIHNTDFNLSINSQPQIKKKVNFVQMLKFIDKNIINFHVYFLDIVTARLEDGPTPYSGILSLYNDNMDEFGLVCMGDFGQNEAGKF